MIDAWLPLGVVLSSFLPGLFIFFLAEERIRLRTVLNLIGALDAGMPWVLAVLAASSLLNAAYFLPILHRVWFRPARGPWPDEQIPQRGRWETAPLLLLPPLATAAATLLAGLFAASAFSPLEWANLIADREYLPWQP